MNIFEAKSGWFDSQSRRTLLRRAGALAGSGILGLGLNSDETCKRYEDPFFLKTAIEGEFNIAIRTRKEILAADRASELEVYFTRITKEDPNHWDMPRLLLLKECLLVWPLHFYAPNEGQKCGIILSNDIDSACCPSVPSEGIKDGVGLSIKHFDPQDRRRALWAATHEFTHRVEFTQRVIKKVASGTTMDIINPIWIKEIDTALGKGSIKTINIIEEFPYEKVNTWREKAKQKAELYKNKIPETPEERDKQIFFERLQIGFLTIGEFIAVLGENYIQGKNRFLQGYSEFFGQQTTQGLYNFTKTKIFRGKEYQTLPIRV